MRASAVADAVVATLLAWEVPDQYLLPDGPDSFVPADRRLRHIEWIAPGEESEALRHLTFVVELGDTQFGVGRPRNAESAITSVDVTLIVELGVGPTPAGQRARSMMARDLAEDVAQVLTLSDQQALGYAWHCDMIEDLGTDTAQYTYAVRLIGHATHQTPT